MSKTNTNTSKPDKKTLLNPIHELIELGHSQGYVTFSNILNYIPEAKKDVASLEKAFASLLKEDIPYLEEDDEDEIEVILIEQAKGQTSTNSLVKSVVCLFLNQPLFIAFV